MKQANVANPVDSFVKYADDFCAAVGTGFLHRVHHADVEQVRVMFAVHVSHLDCADNFRVYPLREGKAFFAQAARGCCGEWNSQIRCDSGRIYWVGCNYGH